MNVYCVTIWNTPAIQQTRKHIEHARARALSAHVHISTVLQTKWEMKLNNIQSCCWLFDKKCLFSYNHCNGIGEEWTKNVVCAIGVSPLNQS